ncbi:hypothetical protein A3860_13580 [Niastella vici]|uniref:Uncharacterized protein n=1 Tax=Niastella vici TaxID=1703345 RepID=A0A1V9G774_9BACT|nr:hypothetical protein A3860_13580 [Niastella vici]
MGGTGVAVHFKLPDNEKVEERKSGQWPTALKNVIFTRFSWQKVCGVSATELVTHARVELVYSFGIATIR